jgi:hypothetical protein
MIFTFQRWILISQPLETEVHILAGIMLWLGFLYSGAGKSGVTQPAVFRDAVYAGDASSGNLGVGHVPLYNQENPFQLRCPGLKVHRLSSLPSQRHRLLLSHPGTHIPYLGPLTGYISWPLGGIFLALGAKGTYMASALRLKGR